MLVVVASLIAAVCTIVYFRTTGPGWNVEYDMAVRLAIRIAAQPLFSLSVIVGASFVGAEWACGAMTTMLTWEARRGRVLSSKLAASASATLLATLVLLAFLALLLLPTSLAHGTAAGLDGSWWWSTSGLWLRAGALSAMGAGLGVGLATLMRNSAGPVATWLVFEFVVAQLIVIWRPGLFRWLPGAAVQQFLQADEIFGATVNGESVFGFSGIRAGLVLAMYSAGMLGVSYAAFRSRDVA